MGLQAISITQLFCSSVPYAFVPCFKAQVFGSSKCQCDDLKDDLQALK